MTLQSALLGTAAALQENWPVAVIHAAICTLNTAKQFGSAKQLRQAGDHMITLGLAESIADLDARVEQLEKALAQRWSRAHASIHPDDAAVLAMLCTEALKRDCGDLNVHPRRITGERLTQLAEPLPANRLILAVESLRHEGWLQAVPLAPTQAPDVVLKYEGLIAYGKAMDDGFHEFVDRVSEWLVNRPSGRRSYLAADQLQAPHMLVVSALHMLEGLGQIKAGTIISGERDVRWISPSLRRRFGASQKPE